ncbi:uncharacterized protein BDZ99DRAFT_466651 [Mytilinidion resinicola]|uniref:Uncharacterized protein n=1 Tax=Mytilinidion resinicola TaxID=574789 RepID=A0A6A6YAW4_9PEZI|nr:uncharacterized protein BDZ99DRAFT_466651 [Mytilinidion resinicola]KAF2805718.1 hypothetical protein BDZ99DRAFT_466651 [Mytilinidion resinicola]
MAPPIAIPPSDTTNLGAALQATLSKVVFLLSWILHILLYIPWAILFFAGLLVSMMVAAITMAVTGRILKIDFMAKYTFGPAFIAIWMGHFLMFIFTILTTGEPKITLSVWLQSLAVVAITLSVLCVVMGALVVVGVWTARGIQYASERRRAGRVGAATDEKSTED